MRRILIDIVFLKIILFPWKKKQLICKFAMTFFWLLKWRHFYDHKNTNSAVSVTAHSPCGARWLEGASRDPTHFGRGVGEGYPTLLASLRRSPSYPTCYVRGGTDTQTERHCSLDRR